LILYPEVSQHDGAPRSAVLYPLSPGPSILDARKEGCKEKRGKRDLNVENGTVKGECRNNKNDKEKKKKKGQDRTGQDRTGQDRTGQDRTGQDRTGQHRAEGNEVIRADLTCSKASLSGHRVPLSLSSLCLCSQTPKCST
jgi:hypothetical protein